ncbi:phosphoadenosine phosphosulfate reductase family protein [Amorphus sp. 3PC139-8]|uniref:phosphoadenosine phosphosulfate reductase domain-containing protein n=1 Tax=Amorphus sp. 3PC139-8 TaxID=2735676 RepID=UPI00345C9937
MSDSPFLLPDGNVQISFSGGRTSAYMLHEILKANDGLPDRARVVFANTGREMPATLDFVRDCGERWGVPITWVEWRPGPAGERFEVVGHNSAARNGEPFEALVRERQFLPNLAARFCTAELKVRAARDYLRSIGWEHWTAAVGIRKDEPKRHAGKADLRERWVRWLPLVDAGVGRFDVGSFWNCQSFDLNLKTIRGKCALGNCDGCFLKSEEFLAALSRDYPDRAFWWERLEAEISALWEALSDEERLERIERRFHEELEDLALSYADGVVPNSVVISLAKNFASGAKFSKRYTRRELREWIEKQGDILLSTEGVLCQADEGECVE